MYKTDLIEKISLKSGMSRKDVEKVIDAFQSLVQDTLKKGEPVKITGFGIFEVRNREERQGRNPQTGEKIVIPATRVPYFRAGKCLKEAIAAAGAD